LKKSKLRTVQSSVLAMIVIFSIYLSSNLSSNQIESERDRFTINAKMRLCKKGSPLLFYVNLIIFFRAQPPSFYTRRICRLFSSVRREPINKYFQEMKQVILRKNINMSILWCSLRIIPDNKIEAFRLLPKKCL